MNLFSWFKKQPEWQSAPKDTAGLTRFLVANDLHIGSEYQDNPLALDQVLALENDGKTILAGDICDFSCCPENKLENLMEIYKNLRHKFANYYLTGNHERDGMGTRSIILSVRNVAQVYFTHGDLDSNFSKWFKYRYGKKGASKLKLIQTKLFDNLDWIKARRPLPDGFLENAAKKAIENNCEYYVCGHFHVEEQRRYLVNVKSSEGWVRGVVVIVLPAHKINEVWL